MKLYIYACRMGKYYEEEPITVAECEVTDRGKSYKPVYSEYMPNIGRKILMKDQLDGVISDISIFSIVLDRRDSKHCNLR